MPLTTRWQRACVQVLHKAIFDEAHKALIYRFGMDLFRDYGAFKKVFGEHLAMDRCHFTESDDDPKAKVGIEAVVEALDAILVDEYLKPTTDVVVDANNIYYLACADVVESTHQAMEALIHNFSTHCTAAPARRCRSRPSTTAWTRRLKAASSSARSSTPSGPVSAMARRRSSRSRSSSSRRASTTTWV